MAKKWMVKEKAKEGRRGIRCLRKNEKREEVGVGVMVVVKENTKDERGGNGSKVGGRNKGSG